MTWANEARRHVIGIFHLLCRFASRAYVRPRISKGEAGSLPSHVDYGGMKSMLYPAQKKENSMKYQKLCDEIITKVGGRDNVLDVSHCITLPPQG